MTNKWAGVQEAAHQPGPQGVPAGMGGGGTKMQGYWAQPSRVPVQPTAEGFMQLTLLLSWLVAGFQSLLNPPPQ